MLNPVQLETPVYVLALSQQNLTRFKLLHLMYLKFQSVPVRVRVQQCLQNYSFIFQFIKKINVIIINYHMQTQTRKRFETISLFCLSGYCRNLLPRKIVYFNILLLENCIYLVTILARASPLDLYKTAKKNMPQLPLPLQARSFKGHWLVFCCFFFLVRHLDCVF